MWTITSPLPFWCNQLRGPYSHHIHRSSHTWGDKIIQGVYTSGWESWQLSKHLTYHSVHWRKGENIKEWGNLEWAESNWTRGSNSLRSGGKRRSWANRSGGETESKEFCLPMDLMWGRQKDTIKKEGFKEFLLLKTYSVDFFFRDCHKIS